MKVSHVNIRIQDLSNINQNFAYGYQKYQDYRIHMKIFAYRYEMKILAYESRSA